MNLAFAVRRLRRPATFVLVLLVIEFLDEFVYGAREAGWPLIQHDLQLSYEQIGLLLGLPILIGNAIEPALGILGDVWKRRTLILGGGVLFASALVLTAISHSFVSLLLAFIALYPASGAFVALSQSSLMDSDTTRHEHNMARWELAGSIGVVVGSLVMGAAAAASASWRLVFAFLSVLTLAILFMASRFRFSKQSSATSDGEDEANVSFLDGVRGAVQALRRREVLRWLALLEFADLMHDVLYGYLALYFVDAIGVQESQAGVAVAVWTCVGLLGDFLVIPLLERVRGLTYVRITALLELVLFPTFLLVPGLVPKVIVLALIGFFNAGWYSILTGQLYSAMPGQSGTVMTLNDVSGLLGGLVPLAIGLVADHFGLPGAMWLLVLGPIALLIGLPRRKHL